MGGGGPFPGSGLSACDEGFGEAFWKRRGNERSFYEKKFLSVPSAIFLKRGLGKPRKLWYTEHTKHKSRVQEIVVTMGSHLVFRCDFFFCQEYFVVFRLRIRPEAGPEQLLKNYKMRREEL